MSKQHYTPVFYLRGFADPASRKTKKAKLWVLESDGGNWDKRHPRDIGWGDDFYAWTDRRGIRHDQADLGLKKVEDWVAPSVNKMVHGRFGELDGIDLANVAVFAAHLKGRAPGVVDQLVEHYGKVGTAHFEDLRTDPAAFARAAEGAGVSVPAELRRKDLAGLTIAVNRAAIAANVVLAAMLDYKTLLERQWGLIEAQPPEYFVVSDHPLYIDEHRATLPLSRTRCLQISRDVDPSPDSKMLGFRKAADGEVRVINIRTGLLSTRFVAAPTLALPGMDVLTTASRDRARGTTRPR